MIKIDNLLEDSINSAFIKGYNYLESKIFTTVETRYGKKIILDKNNNAIYSASEWIKKYDKNYASRTKESVYVDLLDDVSYFIKLDAATFCYAHFVSLNNSNESKKYYNRYYNTSSNVGFYDHYRQYNYLYIFGRHYKKYYDEAHYNILNNVGIEGSSINMFNVSSSSSDNKESLECTMTDVPKRSIDTLFYNKGIKESITDHIDNFLLNREIYKSRNLNYKTGILLYGEPGTGKSSLAIALANKYKYNIAIIDMAKFENINTIELTQAINNDDTSNYIVLMEDIDTLYNLNREDNKDRDEKKIINKMLQFLDSSQSPNNVIFIATTNNIDVLDDAIKRDGRFDLKVNVSGINKSIAKDMVKSFNISDEDADKIISKIPGEIINQAMLQNKILDYFKNNKGEI